MSGSPPQTPESEDRVGTGTEGAHQTKSPLSLLLGALTSGMLGWICLLLSGGLVRYLALHGRHYDSPIAESIASGLQTLLVGMAFLATFSFGFIGIGLLLALVRRLLAGNPDGST